MQYIITKKKKKYFIYDLLKNKKEEPNFKIGKHKDKKVYKYIIDRYGVARRGDYYYITRDDFTKEYLGVLVFESDDLEKIAREFCHLESYGCLTKLFQPKRKEKS